MTEVQILRYGEWVTVFTADAYACKLYAERYRKGYFRIIDKSKPETLAPEPVPAKPKLRPKPEKFPYEVQQRNGRWVIKLLTREQAAKLIAKSMGLDVK